MLEGAFPPLVSKANVAASFYRGTAGMLPVKMFVLDAQG